MRLVLTLECLSVKVLSETIYVDNGDYYARSRIEASSEKQITVKLYLNPSKWRSKAYEKTICDCVKLQFCMTKERKREGRVS